MRKIQAELYKNSNFLTERNDHILYYDCTNYYFEIEQEEGDKKYGKSKEHRPNPIIQIGLFTDGEIADILYCLDKAKITEEARYDGFMPLYKKTTLTDVRHSISGIETDFEFITKGKMEEIQKKSKRR